MKVDWKSILGTVAPTIATALGGPLAGVAVGELSRKLLGKPDGTEDEVAAAVATADPQTLIRLKEMDLEFKKYMSDAGIKLDELDNADRANARDREVKTNDMTPKILAGAVILIWAAVQFSLLWAGLLDQSMREIVARLLGTLDSALMLVLYYYFGSSNSTRHKDETIATIAKMPS